MDKSYGGDSVPELAERYPGACSEVTGRFGDVFNAGEAHDAHGEFAQCCHHAWSVLGSDLGQVLVEGGVADMMGWLEKPHCHSDVTSRNKLGALSQAV